MTDIVSNEALVHELEERILRRSDVMRIFKISQVTLWKWMHGGIVRHHRLGNSVYFLKDEILEDVRTNGGTLQKRHRGCANG